MQFKIPQNVQLEDKIVGPLTLKQLATLGIGLGIAYAFYVGLGKTYTMLVWIWPVGFFVILTLLITFVKINGIPFGKWCFLMVEFMFIPRKRVFIMGAGDVYKATIFAEKEKSKDMQKILTKKEKDQEKIRKLGEITKLLDSYDKTQK